MKRIPQSRLRRLPLKALAVGGCLVVLSPTLVAQGIPPVQTEDLVAERVGLLRAGSLFTPGGGGRTGQATDHAIDFGMGTGPMYVAEAAFLNAAAANDEMTFAVWAKKYDIAGGSVFWANSPSSSEGQRGFQVHLPWSDNRIYFDTAGCCATSQRISEDVGFSGEYTGDVTWWTDNWNLFTFVKKGELKQIWINSTLLVESVDPSAPLPTDFVDLYLGSDGAGGGLFHGLVDDFAIYSTGLTEEQIGQVTSGTSPTALPASAGLVAFWDFNDAPATGQFVSVIPAPDSVNAGPDLIQVVNVGSPTPWTAANVSLRVNGVAVTPEVAVDGVRATVRYLASPLLPRSAVATATLTYPGAGGAPVTSEWQFTVGLYVTDEVASRAGSLKGGATFTPSGGGRSGQTGDYAAHFPVAPAGLIEVRDGTFLNGPAANDVLSFSFWQKLHSLRNATAFWGRSPSVSADARGIQAHVPWSDGTVYYDNTACCNPEETRISQPVNADTVVGYEDASWWTSSWRHFVFVKNGALKEVWIDGVLFLSGSGIALPTDFTSLMLGGGPTVNDNRMAGLMDDFAVFGSALTEAQITALAQGTAPGALAGTPDLLAHWDFNDMPSEGIFGAPLPAPGATTARPDLVQITHVQGTTPWNLEQVRLSIDGIQVAAAVTNDAGVVTVRYVPQPIFAALSSHTAVLTYPGTDGQPRTYEWSFAVGAYTLDTVVGRLGLLTGPAQFSPAGGGRSGAAADRAIDLGTANAQQSVHILDASFLNVATANDELAVVGWQKLYQISDSALFWFSSPSSSGGARGFSVHTPWSNNNLYFDTAGCCDATTQRINGPITDFGLYSGEVTWWQEWRHFVAQKVGSLKEIWIDGELFLQGENTNPLPTDFTQAWIGFDPPDNATLRGLVDDVAFFSKALAPEDIARLASGTLPSALAPATGMLAYWNFNDAPAEPVDGPQLLVSVAGGNVTVTSQPQPLPAGFVLQTAIAVGGPWITVEGQNTPFTTALGDDSVFLRAVRP